MPRSLTGIFPLGLALFVGAGCNNEYSFPSNEATQFAETPPDFGSWLDFDVAPDGRRLTMTYYDRQTSGIGFATGTIKPDGGLEWRHEQVDGYPDADGLDRGDRGKYTSHVVVPDGSVWAAYQDVTNGTLRVAQRLGPNNWAHDMVDPGIGVTASGAGAWASMGLLDGQPIVAHYDSQGKVLRVSRRAEDGTWSNETAWQEDGGDTGRHTQLVVHDGTVYIAFYNVTNGNLELLEGTPGSWSHSQVDTPGDVGAWPSMIVNDNEVLITYQHKGEQQLKLARRPAGGSFTTTVIDDAPHRGADSYLFLHDAVPHVVYFDGQNNDMMLAHQDAEGAWQIERLAGGDAAVGFHNQVVQINGRTFAGSYDHSAKQLFTTELFRPTR